MVEGPLLQSAAAVHFTAEGEWEETKDLDMCITPFIQPLGFDLQKLASPVTKDLVYKEYPELREKTILLFLSRIDPIKGLEILLESFNNIQSECPDLVLVIAGTGEKEYLQSLQALAKGIRSRC